MKAADPVPVTIKVRIGMSDDVVTFREAGKVAEGEGCAYIAFHGRTARQMYWERPGGSIRELKDPEDPRPSVTGISRRSDAFRMMEETGCDGVVIGRGCLGTRGSSATWKRMFDGRRAGTSAGGRSRLRGAPALPASRVALLQTPRSAALMMRKFGTWYVRGLQARRGSDGVPEDHGEEDLNVSWRR